MPASPDLVAYIDGASRGNPGPGAYAVVLTSGDGTGVANLSEPLGNVTNNVAEYRALLAALEYALHEGRPRLRVLSDSELLVRQIQGAYKVKSPGLKPLHDQARRMIARLEAFSIQHVFREQNREADALANETLDSQALYHQDTKTQRRE